MRFLKLTAVVLVVTLIISSCGSNSVSTQQDGVKVIFLKPEIGKERVVNLSEVASAVDYIPLETSA